MGQFETIECDLEKRPDNHLAHVSVGTRSANGPRSRQSPRSCQPVMHSGSKLIDRYDQGSARVVHDEREMALLISTARSADQHSASGVRGSRYALLFRKQVCSAEPCTTGLCPTCLHVYSGTTHIIPIAAIIYVSILITWTVVPDNDAKIQRWIGDRAVVGQCELDDGLVIGGESAEIPKGPSLGHLDIAERASGLRRSGGQGQRRQRNGDQCCQLSGGNGINLNDDFGLFENDADYFDLTH